MLEPLGALAQAINSMPSSLNLSDGVFSAAPPVAEVVWISDSPCRDHPIPTMPFPPCELYSMLSCGAIPRNKGASMAIEVAYEPLDVTLPWAAGAHNAQSEKQMKTKATALGDLDRHVKGHL